MEKLKNKSDIRGAGHLAIDAIRGISDLSEDLHQTIGTLAGLLGSPHHNRTTGLTGLVYHSIRKVSGWAGSGMDILLDHLDSSSEEAGEESASSPKREAILAALNGVLGDHLAASDNPLAIRMQLRQNGSARTLSDPDFIKSLQKSEGKVILMVHGSCLNDLQWERLGHDHGAALARDLGYTPLYLHYNSGLHISENGRALTQLLDQFTQQLPQITELVI
ncbi:alpha/beta hydrolase, partial [Myxococcota bacterium]|nr:alpha/beta hydrolase [Myxococcota bacterium]